MRAAVLGLLLSAAAGGCSSGTDPASTLGHRRQAVTSNPQVVQDPTPPGVAALPPETNGEPMSTPPPNPEYQVRQQQYLQALREQEPIWAAQGTTQDQRDQLRRELKHSILGD